MLLTMPSAGQLTRWQRKRVETNERTRRDQRVLGNGETFICLLHEACAQYMAHAFTCTLIVRCRNLRQIEFGSDDIVVLMFALAFVLRGDSPIMTRLSAPRPGRHILKFRLSRKPRVSSDETSSSSRASTSAISPESIASSRAPAFEEDSAR